MYLMGIRGIYACIKNGLFEDKSVGTFGVDTHPKLV